MYKPNVCSGSKATPACACYYLLTKAEKCYGSLFCTGFVYSVFSEHTYVFQIIFVLDPYEAYKSFTVKEIYVCTLYIL